MSIKGLFFTFHQQISFQIYCPSLLQKKIAFCEYISLLRSPLPLFILNDR